MKRAARFGTALVIPIRSLAAGVLPERVVDPELDHRDVTSAAVENIAHEEGATDWNDKRPVLACGQVIELALHTPIVVDGIFDAAADKPSASSALTTYRIRSSRNQVG